MNRPQWKSPLSKIQAYKRAGGRRRLNAKRQTIAIGRQVRLLELLKAGCTNAEAARLLGVHRSTIGRDLESSLLFEILALPRKLARLTRRMDRIAATSPGAKGPNTRDRP